METTQLNSIQCFRWPFKRPDWSDFEKHELDLYEGIVNNALGPKPNDNTKHLSVKIVGVLKFI